MSSPLDHVLRTCEARFRTLFEYAQVAVVLADGESYYIDANPSACRLFGYARDEFVGLHASDIVVPAEVPHVSEALSTLHNRSDHQREWQFRRKDGSVFPADVVATKMPDGTLLGIIRDISDRRQAEERIAASEQKYRELVELAASIILRWDCDGRVTFLNEFGQQFFGYPADEIVGRLVTDTIVPSTETGGRDLRQLIEDITAAPRAFAQNINENLRRNGERVWISWTNRVITDADGQLIEILSVGTDVSERRRAAARLKESEAHLIEAQRIARVGSWEFDLRTNRFTCSDQVYEIFGDERESFEGTVEAFLRQVHPDDRDRLRIAHGAARAGLADVDVEYRIVLPDRSEKVVHELGKLKYDAAGLPWMWAGTIHDITDRVRMEQEREKRHQAEAADRIKSAFLATMSHELRTPLNSIIGFTGILLQGLTGPLNDEQNKQLTMVRTSARHLLALVNDVLDISKIEAGQLEVAHEAIDVSHSIAKVIALVRPQADAKRLDLRAETAAPMPDIIGDARRFEQILLNLLVNAIKFTETGAVTLTADLVGDLAARADRAVRIRVADTGIGIAAEDLPLVFLPFKQIDSGLARSQQGTGLGLAICARLAGLMGGRIDVESEWGKGSTFTLLLPLEATVTA